MAFANNQDSSPLTRGYPPQQHVLGMLSINMRINGGCTKCPPAQEYRDFLGIDLVVLGFPTVDGFHGERVPEDKRIRADDLAPGDAPRTGGWP